MLFIALTAAIAGAAPAAAMPSPGSVDFDVQCMMTTQQVTGRGNADEKTKSQLALAMMFYFGRIDSAVKGDALKVHIRAAAKRLQGQQLAPVLKQCGQFMTQRGTAMEALGHSLEAEGKSGAAK